MKRPIAPTDPKRPGPPPIRRRLRVRGIVQGVGFRPYVYTLATQLRLAGIVGNDSSGVFIEIEGPEHVLDRFQAELQENPPPLASIERIEVKAVVPRGEQSFAIVTSEEGTDSSAMQRTFVSPDQALCDDCRRELFDPHDRRYRYPFINCTNCGPRFTIIRGMPYDRPLTTMSGFAMCDDCRREYEDPADRRFHAQPVACPACGPQLTFRWSRLGQVDHVRQRPLPLDAETEAAGAEQAQARSLAALAEAQRVLAGGKVLAIKGLGGYHLACDAADEQAVALLRTRKRRAGKPLAVMAANLEAARRIAYAGEEEAAMLAGRVRPIVLLRQREAASIAEGVAPGNGYLGVMLPYSPLHELLFCDVGDGVPPDVLVMTSGNLSEEPIVWRDEDALAKLAGMADAFLLHDRPIHVPCDDSVVRIFEGRELPVRRARGYAPMPIPIPWPSKSSKKASDLALLATGAELKSTFCLAQGGHAILSQHIGDMGNVETYEAFTHAVEYLEGLFRFRPEALACDAHPGYLSTRWAHEHAGGRRVVAVQHHHAHVAALMAEQAVGAGASDEPVIGFSFDGTGFGGDGAIWGGEVLLANYTSFERRAHLRYVPLPGGDSAVRRPYRTALAHLWAAGSEWAGSLPPVAACPPAELALLQRQLETGFNTVLTSSMGRLCDAVAALAGVCQVASYEAQAAIELESLIDDNTFQHCAEPNESNYAFHYIEGGSMTIVDPAPLIRQVAADVQLGRSAEWIAGQFHAALVALIVRLSNIVRAETGLGRVALSGGVFQNAVLLGGAVRELRRAGFTVLVHQRVPPNDGGLALGQAIVAARQLWTS